MRPYDTLDASRELLINPELRGLFEDHAKNPTEANAAAVLVFIVEHRGEIVRRAGR